jgi:aminoglycoside phosphotransferase family enzyme
MMARFHQNARIAKQPFDAQTAKADFADLASVVPILEKYVDKNYGRWAAGWIQVASSTIDKYEWRLAERAEEGFVRDGHGDLHSGNIFLLQQPVIFDCIEFNEHFRINDVLSEMAFLAMDLERNGRSDLKDLLIATYRKGFPCFLKSADEAIFQYFLLYRASVRLKIAAIRLGEDMREGEGADAELLAGIRALADLCKRYAESLQPLG